MSVVNTEDTSDSSHAFVALGCVRQLGAHRFEDHKITPVGTEWLSAPLGTAAVVSLPALHSSCIHWFPDSNVKPWVLLF